MTARISLERIRDTKVGSFGEPLPVHCLPHLLFSSLCYLSSNARVSRVSTGGAEPGCLKEEVPGRKAGEEERSHADQASV